MSSGKIEKGIIRILIGNLISQNIPPFNKERFQIETSCNQKFKDEFCDYLEIIKEIHRILLECSNLTYKERYDYCNSQRYFMKAYLKKLTEKKRI
jgi:hypothetical protein